MSAFSFDKKATIVFVDPVQDWNTWKTCAHSLIEPLGLEIIAALLEKYGYLTNVFQAQAKKLELISEDILRLNPQIVGITSYTYNSDDAQKLASILKSKNDKIKIIYGGYHSSFIYDSLKKNLVDYIIRGPGEYTILELIMALDQKTDLRSIKSLVFKINDKIIENPLKKKPLIDIDNIPYAKRNRSILKGCSINSMMNVPKSEKKNTAAIFTTRGCPYSCAYCTSLNFYNRQVQFRSVRNVVSEIEYLQNEFDVNILFFTDLTFNLNRNYVIKICDEIIRKKIRIYWYALFRPEGVDEELAIKLKKAGCLKVAVGIETLDHKTLNKINRGNSSYYNNLKTTVRNLHSVGILVRGLLMIGFPWETHETYKTIYREIENLSLDEIRVGIITPFPGTQIYKEFNIQKKLISRNYCQYDSRHLVIAHNHLTSQEVLDYAEDIFSTFN